jgi:glycerol-3-phosphate dehydrogenase (NAD(P)+)
VKLAVLGAGAWGTALALQAERAGHAVCLFGRDPEHVATMRGERENARHLAGVRIPDQVLPTSSLEEAAGSAEAVIVAVPSEFCRGLYADLADVVRPGARILSATKGIDVDSLERMSELASAALPGHPVAVLSGPSFAREVADRQPTAVVVASADLSSAEVLQRALSTRRFRVYSSDDVTGVELAGALKNVIAIAAGIVDGLGHGHNTVAALITRGLAEISRLAGRLGGRPDTLAGLAGLGDLVLTCTGALSRNRRVGQALGRGMSLDEARAVTGSVAEGVRTTRAAADLAERCEVDMPITFAMREVLYRGRSPREAVDRLMLRRLKRE